MSGRTSQLGGLVFAVLGLALSMLIGWAAVNDSRQERRERQDRHDRVRALIVECVNDYGTPEYSVTDSGWLLDFYGCTGVIPSE